MSQEKSNLEVRPLFLCCLLSLLTDAFPSFPEVSINGIFLPDAPAAAKTIHEYICIPCIMRNSCFSFNGLELFTIRPIGKASTLP